MICGLTFNYTRYKRFTGGGGINKISVNFIKDSIKERRNILLNFFQMAFLVSQLSESKLNGRLIKTLSQVLTTSPR